MSRQTFRSVVHDVAWQRQLRDRFAREGLPAGLRESDLVLKRAKVRPVSRAVAEQIILKYEWLGTMAPTGLHFGIFFGLYCGGVTCISTGAGSGGTNIHTPFGVERNEIATLARGACVHWAPPGTNSKLVSWTTRLARSSDSRLKLLIAYADTDAGEIGTIYQACNWHYIGKGSQTRQWVSPEGRVMDQKLPSNVQASRNNSKIPGYDQVHRQDVIAALRSAGWREQVSNPKHRYVALLDKDDTALRARLDSMSFPYPKRADEGLGGTRPESITDDAPVIHTGEGGSTPTSGLLHDNDTDFSTLRL